MAKTFFLFISLIFLFIAESTAIPIEGKVMDKTTGKPLAGAHILFPRLDIATITGQDGSFNLEISNAGSHRMEITYVGYQSLARWVETTDTAPIVLDIRLQPTIYSSEEVVITASRNNENIKKIPARISIISRTDIEANPHDKIEDILKYTTGINVLNPSGMYSMRPVVTLRGLGGDEQGRTLILLDGAPLNKGDTGDVNWSGINADDVERIEVFHGPGSSIYGNNAMGGVINIITRKPTKPVEGGASVSYGTYNTLMTSANIGGTQQNGLYYRISGMYNSSDGYNDTPEELKEDPDYSVAKYLDEYNISAKAGWAADPLLNAELQYDHYRNKKGEGEKIEAPDGEYRNFDTDFLGLRMNGNSENFSYSLNLYYQKEHYYKLDERMKSGVYSRFDVMSDRIDKGLIANFTNYLTLKNKLIYGIEARFGSVEGGDYYVTSPDSVVNEGKMDNYAIFVQDEHSFLDNMLNLTLGVRYDIASFHDGAYLTTDGSWTGILPELNDHEWSNISPRVGLNYRPKENLRFYVSWSQGFRASILDDLCRSGWMWVGPKIANPELGPETINNYEIGGDFSFDDKLKITSSLFFAKGKDFLYYVANGDSLWGKWPVFQRQNITKVNIYGFDIHTSYLINDNFSIFANYTFNHSEIDKFDKDPELEGKMLKYTPSHQVKAGTFIHHQWIDVALAMTYKSKQFTSDNNQNHIDPFVSFDARISKTMGDIVDVYAEVIDIFDNQELETEYYLSPGRRISLGISLRF